MVPFCLSHILPSAWDMRKHNIVFHKHLVDVCHCCWDFQSIYKCCVSNFHCTYAATQTPLKPPPWVDISLSAVVIPPLKSSFLLPKGAAHIRLLHWYKCSHSIIFLPAFVLQFLNILLSFFVQSCSRAIRLKQQQATHHIK